MTTKKNINKSAPLRVTITAQTEEFLRALIATGYYSGKVGTVAGAIVEERVRELVSNGYLEKAQTSLQDVQKILAPTSPIETKL